MAGRTEKGLNDAAQKKVLLNQNLSIYVYIYVYMYIYMYVYIYTIGCHIICDKRLYCIYRSLP